uniref:Uncharacterized protein n=1 Tax=Anguilla anguilla TaxID=7936 RepID=A0A0E9VNB6_ANGAN
MVSFGNTSQEFWDILDIVSQSGGLRFLC